MPLIWKYPSLKLPGKHLRIHLMQLFNRLSVQYIVDNEVAVFMEFLYVGSAYFGVKLFVVDAREQSLTNFQHLLLKFNWIRILLIL